MSLHFNRRDSNDKLINFNELQEMKDNILINEKNVDTNNVLNPGDMQPFLPEIENVEKDNHDLSNIGDSQKHDNLQGMEQSPVINTSVLNNKDHVKHINISKEKLPLSISCNTKKVSNSC